MKIYHKSWLVLFLFISGAAPAQSLKPAHTKSPASFDVIPLGVRGGLDESNLSSYMVSAAGAGEYICLDAGTLYSGIRKAVANGALPPPAAIVLRSTIKAYFISHPHLDHIAGLIINSPDDSAKSIYGLTSCLKVLQEKYFTWAAWANFGDQGEKPQLKKYHYITMDPGQEMPVPGTGLSVKAFTLSHGAPYESTAFLVRNGDHYLLYLGDTGADTLERSDKLHQLWQAVAPLISSGKLKAIFIESSFPSEQPDKALFGHLTPRLLMLEMKELGGLAGMDALKGLPVVVTHMKPSGDQEKVISKELRSANTVGLNLVFPEQGRPLKF
jgi:cAMP phosphodiesterase